MEEEKKEPVVDQPQQTAQSPVEASKESPGKKKARKEKMRALWAKNKNTLIAAIVLVVIAGASIAYVKYSRRMDIGPEAIKAKTEAFLKGKVPEGVTISTVTKKNGVYEVMLKADAKQGGKEQPVYVSPDGAKIFQGAFDMDQAASPEDSAQQQQAQAPAQKDIPKNNKPNVDLYVMAFCPYGNKAEDTLKSAYDLLKNKVNFNFHYIVNISGSDVQSLHGAKEVAEDEREACVLKTYGKDKWMGLATYVNGACGSDGACWEDGAKSLGINVATVNACVSSQGLALMQANEKASNDANATGSPTLTINGVATDAVYQYDNAEAYKQAICRGFTTQPKECQTKLAEKAATGTATPVGSCTTP